MKVSQALHEYIVSVMESRDDRGEKCDQLKELLSEDFGSDIDKWVGWFSNNNEIQEGKKFIGHTYSIYKLNKKYP